MPQKIKDFIQENSAKLPLFLSKLSLSSHEHFKSKKKIHTRKVIAMKKYNTERYEIQYLHKPISKI